MDDNFMKACLILALLELRTLLNEPSESARIPVRVGGENGSQYIHRLLYTPGLCKEQLRLDRDMFQKLVQLMVDRKLLSDGRYVSVAEQFGICLYILAKGVSYRDAADRFQHSVATIGKYFKAVLCALVTLSYDIVRPHGDLSVVPPEIANNSLYWPFFKDCIGALDGTHIQAIISDNNGVPFRGRKGNKTWNILASCSFDRIFTFINVGWEGSVHDVTVWVDSLTQSKYAFPHPPEGKYYLVDSGYPNTMGYLSPIKDTGVRYHITEFKKNRELKGMLEQFNYRHSSLRTTIERAFGILKATWRILQKMPQMEEKYQLFIIVATITLHNFIRMCELGIQVQEHDSNIQGRVDHDLLNPARKEAMNKVRDEIALNIWHSIQNDMEMECDLEQDNIQLQVDLEQESVADSYMD